jgi:biopolymer transport protein ExbD
MTPLIDMVFLLVLFFMVTYNYSNELTAIGVNLPSVGKQGRMPVASLDVRVTRSEELYLADKKVSLEGLKKALVDAKMTADKVAMTVYADKLVTHGAVVGILDVATNVGVDSLSIAALSQREARKI